MTLLTRWDPFRTLRSREELTDFDDLLRDLFGRTEGVLEPAIEVSEADGEVVVKAALPGVEKDQLHVSVENDRLTVRGEVKKEEEKKDKNYFRREIRYGTIQRAIALPVEVDAEKAKAELKNGMLTVRIPKSTKARTREIPVQVAA
ncbi:MAG TPA: Hsp20/alpha crystallin family protein [Candidatus Limnocylindria bacterium]|nr:Hsp20/alpha crystallin family protein [Candidatus Limnocylindria bacterium]